MYAKPGTDLPNAVAVRRKESKSFELKFDEARNLISVTAIQCDNKKARLESLRAVRMDPRFRDYYHILYKFLDKKHVLDRTESFQLALTLSAFFRGQKIALVVGKAGLATLSECIATFNTGRVDVSVFSSVASAKSWLAFQQEAIAA
jgi:hypothetical protein